MVTGDNIKTVYERGILERFNCSQANAGKGFPICEKHDCTKILPHRLWNIYVTLLSVNTDHSKMISCFSCWYFTQHFNFFVIRVLKHLKVFCKMSFIRSFINKNRHDAIVRRNKTTSCSVSHCRSSTYKWCFSNDATLN